MGYCFVKPFAEMQSNQAQHLRYLVQKEKVNAIWCSCIKLNFIYRKHKLSSPEEG